MNCPSLLLSDTEKKTIMDYDVWKEKKELWEGGYGCCRTTYLIDEEGMIIKAKERVKTADNPRRMLQALS